jgi:tRNA threonylcarbamoyl adenosine modification protein YeaZ
MTRVLAIDTATSQTIAALSDGARLSATSEQRHGALLLGLLERLFAEPGTASPRDLAGVVAGTGPGNFTGLRIGMATAKTIAYANHIPIVGVPTSAALARAAVDADSGAKGDGSAPRARMAVLQPAGPTDRYLSFVRIGADDGSAELIEPPRVLSPTEAIGDVIGDAWLVAVDVAMQVVGEGSVPEDARERGKAAVGGLGEALLSIGLRRLQEGRVDDVAELVPTYVTLPRGVIETAERVEWSPALR